MLYLIQCYTLSINSHISSKQGGQADWINTAEDIVRAEFKCSYAIENDNEDEQEVGDGRDIVMVRQSKFFILF